MSQLQLSITLIALVLSAHALVGQTVPQRPLGNERLPERMLPTQTLDKDRAAEALAVSPMEGPVDPETYVVGPSDLLHVGVWGPLTLSHTIPVTPEGSIIIPTVGEIQLAGKSLAEAKREVGARVRREYKIGDVTLTLVKPRSFIVTLRGAVLKEGQYIASAVDRVEKILREGSTLEPLRASANVLFDPTAGVDPFGDAPLRVPGVRPASTLDDNASLRNVRLIRRSGDTVHVDLLKFHVHRDDRLNPFLRDGDVIEVPTRNLSRNFVTVDGEVHSPGQYEFVEGDDLLTLLSMANGLKTAADSSRVLMYRMNEFGEMIQPTVVNLREVRAGRADNLMLNRRDRIVVQAQPHAPSPSRVFLTGEIKTTGQYPIGNSGKHLSKVIEEAGGFTNHAFLPGGMVLRLQSRLHDVVDRRLELLRMMRAYNVPPSDSAYFVQDFEVGRQPVVVDFVRLFVDRDTTADVLLHHGDIVYIPSQQQTILVQGQIANPGYINYVPGMPLSYYIQRAGGYSELAITGEVKVIKRGSLVWVDPSDTEIEAGDRIWVPKKPLREFEYYTRVLSNVATIVSAITTTIILIIQISR